MGQMRDNPTLMSQMMSAPYMQGIFRGLQDNPDQVNRYHAGPWLNLQTIFQAAAILSNNPMFAGNPALQQQMSAMMPQLLQQMQNPQTQQLMSNPEALAAIMQIQQGMDRLRAAAPELYQSMGLPSLPPNLVPSPAAAGMASRHLNWHCDEHIQIHQAHLARLQLLQVLQQGVRVPRLQPRLVVSPTRSSFRSSWHRLASSNSGLYYCASNCNPSLQMMGQMRAGNPEQAPEERFASQLDQLASMGFVDRQANIQGGKTIDSLTLIARFFLLRLFDTPILQHSLLPWEMWMQLLSDFWEVDCR